MMGFLAYLNFDIFVFISGAILFGVVTYMIPMIVASRLFKHARNKIDDLQEGIKGNIYGAKELKLSQSRRLSYFDEVLLENEKAACSANKKVITVVRTASNYGDMVSFFVIGYVAFIFVNYHGVTPGELLAAVMVMLYITGPISIVMNALPEIINANVSLIKVEDLFADIPIEDIGEAVKPLPDWQTLVFNEVVYQYPLKDKNQEGSFEVGPINLTIKKGQVTFIVGGNGSGKSTLSKLLLSYYHPKSGSITLDGQLLTKDYVKGFRDQISAIYTDYYLFDQLPANHAQQQQLIDKLLESLHLSEKVQIVDGRFSTLSLSDGQRKRLALLVSMLEDKPLYLFDEWAADQDPEFKQVFYYQILPYLKKQGKAVICISHDDRYFSVADQILTMENGKCSSLVTETHEHQDNNNETVFGTLNT